MKHKSFLLTVLTLFVALFASANSPAQSVADDFWIYDFSTGSGIYTVRKNDDRPYNSFYFVSGPSYGNAFWYATGTMGYNPYSTSQIYLDTASYKTCEGNPLKCTNTANVLILVIGSGENNLDYGAACPISKGRPVNVGNGNMWLRQSDYNLPGLGEPTRIERFYNSRLQQPGLFGLGWTTHYDESLTIYEDRLVRLNMPDARGVYFARANTSDPFKTVSPDARAGLVKNVDSTYTLTFEDGRVHKFSASGRLEWQRDRNGNQTALSYNGNGHLISVTDAVGRVVTFTPNSNGTIAQVSDSIGVIADYEYSIGTTHLKTVTYPDGSKYKFEYNTTAVAGKVYLATVKDALDNVLETHQYNSQGRATTSELDGGVEKYTINYTNSQLSTVTDALGRVSKYSYKHQYGRKTLTSVEGVCGCGAGGSETTAYEYDWVPRITKETDALGRITRYTYDLDGNLLLRDDPIGDQKWTYDSNGRVLTYKDRADSALPDLVTTDNATSLTTPFSYTGNLTVGGPTNAVSYISNDINDPRTVTYHNANGLLSLDMYYIWHSSVGDSGFQVEKSTDNSNWIGVTTSVYSTSNIGGGWTRKRIRNLNITGANYIRITYLNNNATYPWSLGIDSVTLTTPSTVYTVATTYDANGNLLTTTDALGNVTTLAYTPLGQLSTITDARNNSTSLTYDTYGRLTQVTDANSKNTTYGYDTRARLTSRTNALNETTIFEYDLNNRLEKVTHPDTNYREFTYDLAGRRTAVKDERGNTTSYGYDNAYRLTSITDPLYHTTSIGYDLMSNVTSRADALGNTTNYEYDDFNRLKKVVFPPATTGATRLEESITYDKAGNVKTRVDTAGRTTSYDYDAIDRLFKITDPLLKLTQFEYNLRSHLTKVKDALNQEYVFTYDALSRELTQTRAGTARSYQYS
jgi:YD repeat-containing protein